MPQVQERMVGQGEGESDQHYNAKRELCEFLNRHGIEAFMEYPVLARTQGYHRFLDVGVPSLKLAFEIQRGRGNEKYAEWRAGQLEEDSWHVILLPIESDGRGPYTPC